MRRIFLGIVGLLALQAPAMAAAAPGAACEAAVDAAKADWRAASFTSPAKPAQAWVLGQSGRELSGAQYQLVMREIRQATAACRVGDQATAIERADAARALLHGNGV